MTHAPEKLSIAVVGAGIAGLAAGEALLAAGCTIQIFDKGRGLGGRLATRRAGALSFDHGVQYVTARGDAFRDWIERAMDAGHVASWEPSVANDHGQRDEEGARRPRYVGVPGMSGLARAFSSTTHVTNGVEIVSPTQGDDGWHLEDASGLRFGPFNGCILTVPFPQAIRLAATHLPTFAEGSKNTVMAPCWTGLFAFDAPLSHLPDLPSVGDGAALSWVARNSSKPGRQIGAGDAIETWVVQASHAWSRANLEREKSDVAADLLAAFRDIAGDGGLRVAPPIHADAHRWRYAFVESPLGRPAHVAPDVALAIAGDWCVAPRVEAAFDSGRAAAAGLLDALSAHG